MKTIFLGTPALAVPFLELLSAKTQVLGVVTNPDQPAGRGYELKASEIKQAAQRLSLPVHQPETLKNPAFAAMLKALAPEIGIVVAYGKLIPKDILTIPRHGFLNVHFSLLPKYRGAAPIQWTLINGEKESGVTLFWLDEGMDTGPIFSQRELVVDPEDDAESLRHKLVVLGVNALEAGLKAIEQGILTREPQSGPGSKAPILKKEDGKIDWGLSVNAIINKIRGMTPWPGAYGVVEHKGHASRLKVLKASVVPGAEAGPVGALVRVESGVGIVVKCGQGLLRITQVQPEGKRSMSAWDFWQGAHLKPGDQIG